MENSVGSAIEKIKLQEQDKEAKLKEKRELEAIIATLNRGIRDAVSLADKAHEDTLELVLKTDQLQAQLALYSIRKEAMAAQLEACTEELNQLRGLSDKGMSEVWKLRSTLTESVQKVSEQYDIWPLFTKPLHSNHVQTPESTDVEPEVKLENEGRLKNALERKDKAKMEKARLMCEPEMGEEFVRTNMSTGTICTRAAPNLNSITKYNKECFTSLGVSLPPFDLNQ